MNVVTRRILYCNYEHAKTSILRLCEKSRCMSGTWKKETLTTFQIDAKRYKHSSQHRNRINFAEYIPENKKPSYMTTLREYDDMHSILEDSVYYEKSIMPPIKTYVAITDSEIQQLNNVDWSSQTPNVILSGMKKLTYCRLTNQKFQDGIFDNILEACNDKLDQFNNAQIKKLMQCLILLNNMLEQSNIGSEFINNLSKECLNRFFSSNIDELLLIADGFSQLKAWKCDYLWRALRKIGSKSYKLSSKQIVQFLLLSSMVQVPDINMYDIQCSLEENLPELSVDEVGIVARGFFLNEKPIISKTLIQRMIQKVTINASVIHYITLAAIMKLIRYSNCRHCPTELYALLIALENQISRLPLFTLTHIMHAIGGQRHYNKRLIGEIFLKTEPHIKLARIKDIERFLYTLCTVTPYREYHEECNKLVDEVIHTYKSTREKEIEMYRKPLPRLIVFLSYKNIYPRELIDFVMKPQFVTKVYEHNLKLLSNEHLFIDCCLKIDLPDYTGPFLDNRLYKYFVQKFCVSVADTHLMHGTARLRSEILYLCKEHLGFHIFSYWISPHFVIKDSIFGFDEHNNPVPVEPILSAMPVESIKRVDTNNLKNIKWKVLFPLTVTQKVEGHDGYICSTYAKYKQLKALGYTPVPISEHKWATLHKTTEKIDYLKEEFFEGTTSNIFDREFVSESNK